MTQTPNTDKLDTDKPDSEQNGDTPDRRDEEKAPNLFQVMGSVLSAFFGVQSSKNKERDFKHGNHKVFIVVGIIMTAAFLATVITVVQLVLANR